MIERDKDMSMRIQDLERENSDLSLQNRQVISDLARLQRDLRQLLAINEEF